MFKMCCLPCGALAREWLTAADQNKAVCRPYLLFPLYAVLLLCEGRRIRGGPCVSFRISCCGCVVAVVDALVAVVAVIVAAVIPRKMSSKQRKLAKRFLLFGGFADEAEAGDGRQKASERVNCETLFWQLWPRTPCVWNKLQQVTLEGGRQLPLSGVENFHFIPWKCL